MLARDVRFIVQTMSPDHVSSRPKKLKLLESIEELPENCDTNDQEVYIVEAITGPLTTAEIDDLRRQAQYRREEEELRMEIQEAERKLRELGLKMQQLHGRF